MEFKFKRKYTNFFLIAILLHLLLLLFWLFAPSNIFASYQKKQIITLLALINCELILIFYLGLFRKKYFAYYNKIVIKRSFFKTLSIDYNKITDIKEKPHDHIFLRFGKRPSFTIYYKNNNNRRKKYLIRSDNTNLLIKVIKNEIDIAKIK